MARTVFEPTVIEDGQGHTIDSVASQWKARFSKSGGANIVYSGYTRPGTAETSAGWLISKHTYDASGDIIQTNFAEGRAQFKHIWDSGTQATITGITQADPGVVTAANHGFSDDDVVEITGVVGMTEANGNFYIVDDATTNTFSLNDLNGDDVDTTGFTAYTSGGIAHKRDYCNFSFS